MRPKKVIKIKVLGRPWRVKVWSKGQYLKHIAQDSQAECFVYEKTIHVDYSCVTFEDIKHEVSHAIFDERSFIALQLDKAQWEEFSCETMAKHAEELINVSKDIFQIVKES